MDRIATSATLLATFAQCQPGDRLVLNGAFDMIVLQGRSFDPSLAIDASAATTVAVIIKSCAGLAWSGGAMKPAGGRAALAVYDSSRITFDRLHIESDGTQNGVTMQGCQNLAVTGAFMLRPRVGISLASCANAMVTGNTIIGWSADGIGMKSLSDSTISDNVLLDPVRTDAGMHMDAIQGYYDGATPNVNLTITRNVIRGRGTQAIFLNTYAGYPPPQKITITDNVVNTADAPNGILLQADPHGFVARNHAYTMPGSQWQTGIFTLDAPTPRSGNTVAAFGPWPALTDPGTA